MIVSKSKKMPPTFFAHEWVPLKAVLRRIISITELREDALRSLNRDLRSGRLRSALLEISSDDKETMTLLNPSDWQQRTVKATINPEESVWVEPYVAGLRYFVRRANLDKCYPTPTTTDQSDDTPSPRTTTSKHDADDTRPPERRRGPVLKHDWLAICGEIARRCINPKTRLLKIPKNERKLAQDMLGWCQEKYDRRSPQTVRCARR